MLHSFEVSPQQAKDRLARDEHSILVDVREPGEFAISKIPGSRLIPMQYVPTQLSQLREWAAESDLLVLCHHGVRSLQVVNWLRQQAIPNCYSVAGGIDGWSHDVDPQIPRY